MTRITIMQSNYIPWKGYFDLARCSDIFVFLDMVQYTKGDWRNRNKILLNGQEHWLTIPVITSGKMAQAIEDTQVKPNWAMGHFQTITQAYKKSPFFTDYKAPLKALYEEADSLTHLSAINRLFFKAICQWLDISVTLKDASDLPNISDDPTQRLLDIIAHFDGQEYLSGPAAQAYLDQDKFTAADIDIVWADYGGYCDYPQLADTFHPFVTALDLLFNKGPEARDYLSDIHQKSADGNAL